MYFSRPFSRTTGSCQPAQTILLLLFILSSFLSALASTCDSTDCDQTITTKEVSLVSDYNLEAGSAAHLLRRKRAKAPLVKLASYKPKPIETTSAAAEKEDEFSAADDSENDSPSEEPTTKPPTSTRRPKAAPVRNSQPTKAGKGGSGKSQAKQSSAQRETAKLESKSTEGSRDEQQNEESELEETQSSTAAAKSSKKSKQTLASSNNNATSTTRHKSRPLVKLPFLHTKNESLCTPEAYLEFPPDLIGNKWRARGFVIVHVLVVCYMFYSLTLVCDRYFMPSLNELAQRLQLSEDVAGATLMSAGSSAPELFTALLGVFVAKGDVGTGAIVGSAVFNILCVIGICAFVSTTTAQLSWWPVLRDSVYYTFTVLVLILFIYDERITMLESATMIALYGVYILIMVNNERLKEQVTQLLYSNRLTRKFISSAVSVEGPDDVFGSTTSYYGSSPASNKPYESSSYQTTSLTTGRKTIEEDSMFLAAMLVIMKHKRLFRSGLRFQSAARYIIVKRQHKLVKQHLKQQKQQQQTAGKLPSNEVNYFGPENEPLNGSSNQNNQKERMAAYAKSAPLSKNKYSIVSREDYEFWNRPLKEGENHYIWLAKIPVNYVLHYTVPDCALYPDKYLFTFIISIIWTAIFSYIMVWMVTLIGFTIGVPDSVMGVTFLAIGTSVPDCYSSIHAARKGQADMAVSNSIGSNVFDILIGLSLPWFIQAAIGQSATINSRGVIYSVILLFLSLIVTIYLMNKYEWTLKPRLGLALLIAYGLFIVLTTMLEFNLFGHVNPLPCPVPG